MRTNVGEIGRVHASTPTTSSVASVRLRLARSLDARAAHSRTAPPSSSHTVWWSRSRSALERFDDRLRYVSNRDANRARGYRQPVTIDVSGVIDRGILDQRADVVARAVAEVVPPARALIAFAVSQGVPAFQRSTFGGIDPRVPSNGHARFNNPYLDHGKQRDEEDAGERNPRPRPTPRQRHSILSVSASRTRASSTAAER